MKSNTWRGYAHSKSPSEKYSPPGQYAAIKKILLTSGLKKMWQQFPTTEADGTVNHFLSSACPICGDDPARAVHSGFECDEATGTWRCWGCRRYGAGACALQTAIDEAREGGRHATP